MKKDTKPKDLYPDLVPQRQEEARHNLRQYVDLVNRIYKRLKSQGKLKSTLLKHQWLKRKRK